MATDAIQVLGKPLRCGHCGHERFETRKAQLNTAILTLFRLDWLNATAEVFVCGQCGFLHWFLRRGEDKDVAV